MNITEETVEKVFTYQKPTAEQRACFVHIRGAAKFLANTILSDCPGCRERSLALTKLQEVVHWASEAVVLDGALGK